MLSRQTLQQVSGSAGLIIPEQTIFDLPEKVLQFGTGVLLRGLPDYFIDKANRQGVFNGRIVVVKSTDSGDSSAFDKQDGLYTVCVKGIENGAVIESDIINSSISRVLSAKSQWHEILQCAHNEEMAVIISNTTEVGIALVNEDIRQAPPASFPGKLLAFLHERFIAFQGMPDKGMVVIPTELIVDNGKKLKDITLELARFNKLEEPFIEWLQNSNHFCSSLVDRIVPGKPSPDEKTRIASRLGYQDELLIIAEVYRLWAIESASGEVKDVLSFSQVDEGVAIAPDITKFRELKLRLLNGTHTLSCGLAVLAGFETVKEAMADEKITGYMHRLMTENIIPAVINDNISEEEARQFASSVLDRFRNPFLDHKWLSISVQYSSKIKMRVLPVLFRYYERFNKPPEFIAFGFAAFILFMKGEKSGTGTFSGLSNGSAYTIQDDNAEYYSNSWTASGAESIVLKVLSDSKLWDKNLAELDGFADAVTRYLHSLLDLGAKQTLGNLINEKSVLQL